MTSPAGPPLVFSPEVAAARDAGRPLVALESTIITHGMPWPDNAATARLVEREVRDAGATPATIAVLDGRLHVGLDDAQIVALGRARDVWKLSRADLAVGLAAGRTGATTVAANIALVRNNARLAAAIARALAGGA